MNDDRSASLAWLPIDSAPKDGTVILAYRPDQGVFAAHHVDHGDFLGLPEDEWEQPGWWTTDGGDLSSPDLMPTHWMPMPEPPSSEAAVLKTPSGKEE